MAGTQRSLAYSSFEILLGWDKFPTRPKSALWAISEVALGCALRHSFLPVGGSN